MPSVCDTISVANYFIKKCRENGENLNKTKLQNMLVYAHIKYARENNMPLVSEKISLMHFGFIFKSIAKLFECLDYDEAITRENYVASEICYGKIVCGFDISKDIKDPEQLANTQLFLDSVIERFNGKSLRDCVNENIRPNTLWHTIAFKRLKGNHLINDYTDISNNLIVSISLGDNAAGIG